MKKIETSLDGLTIFEPAVFTDERGAFFELYSTLTHGEMTSFVQDNCTISRQGVIRGLHFQQSPGQAKLVSVLQGEIYDVAVDIRPESATFKQWVAVSLNDKNRRQLYLPVGFAHGFCVLSEQATVLYKLSALYDAKQEKGFRFDDPEIAVTWPVKTPILSLRDQNAPSFDEAMRCIR